MVIFPLAPDQTIAQMWSNGARGGEPDRQTEPCHGTVTSIPIGEIDVAQ